MKTTTGSHFNAILTPRDAIFQRWLTPFEREADSCHSNALSEFFSFKEDYAGPRQKSIRRGGGEAATAKPFEMGDVVVVSDNDSGEVLCSEGIVLKMEKKELGFSLDTDESEEEKRGKWWGRVLHINPPKNKAEEGAIKLYHLRHFAFELIPDRLRVEPQHCAKLTAMYAASLPSNLKLKAILPPILTPITAILTPITAILTLITASLTLITAL